MKTIRIFLLVALAGVTLYVGLAYEASHAAERAAKRSVAAIAELAPSAWQLDITRVEEERALFLDAARRAWSYIERHYQPETGFIRTVPGYDVTTLWDIASGLAALYSGAALGLLSEEEYERRMTRALETLAVMPLFDDVAFNKAYDVATASMVDRRERFTRTGYGWSATDLGRLLVWLKIIATHQPQHALASERIVDRMDMRRIVVDGYLRGGEANQRGRRISFQEGRIGYEQYAAHGFALWGFTAERALDVAENGVAAMVLGTPVLSDRRSRGCLTSEPYILTGLELGWNEQDFRLALSLLAAQRERYERTGQVTIVSEDASGEPPHYFYYYCALFDGVEFGVTAQAQDLLPAGPRTVSTKGAFGWYALSPNPYTKLALETVTSILADHAGWPASIHEEGRVIGGPENVNTAAVILESALFVQRGRTMIRQGEERGRG